VYLSQGTNRPPGSRDPNEQPSTGRRIYDWVVRNLNIRTRPKRTACWTVTREAEADFRQGKVAAYKVESTWNAIVDALGYADRASTGLTFQDAADIHIQRFVPLCIELEAGRHTEHPDEGLGLQIRTDAYREFTRRVRSGEVQVIPWPPVAGPVQPGEGRQSPPGRAPGRDREPSGDRSSSAAGLPLGTMFALGVGAYALARSGRRRRS